MVQITLRYIPIQSEASFLQIKQTEVVQYPYYLPVFFAHVFSAIFAIPAGFTQFNKSLLKSKPKWHRMAGKLYVFAILAVAAPSGFIIGLHANGGTYSVISFTLLALCWFGSTGLALRFALQKNWNQHRNWMYRSYALTLSAVTLRLWKVILVYLFEPHPMEVYQVIAWLGWIPNWLVAEYLIFRKK